MKILIAEDNDLTRELLEEQMLKEGHDVLAVANGKLAVASIVEERPHVLVTDWVMPELDGLDLCRWVREDEDSEYLFVLMLTSIHTSKDDYHVAMEAGVDDFLVRPCQPRDLVARLRVAERLQRYARENRQLKRLIPICMYCRKVRDDRDYWLELESFFQAETETVLSHGICPSCYDTVALPEIERIRNQTRKDS